MFTQACPFVHTNSSETVCQNTGFLGKDTPDCLANKQSPISTENRIYCDFSVLDVQRVHCKSLYLLAVGSNFSVHTYTRVQDIYYRSINHFPAWI